MVIILAINRQQIKLARHHCTRGIEKQNASLFMWGRKEIQYKTHSLVVLREKPSCENTALTQAGQTL
jgi:hypothetical protein